MSDIGGLFLPLRGEINLKTDVPDGIELGTEIMKKKIWMGTLAVFAVLSVSVLLLVACKKKEPPQAPTGLKVEASDGYVTFTWDPVEDADYYYVEYYMGSGPVYGTSYTEGPFINEVDLTFSVAAVNEYGESAYSWIVYHYFPNNGGGGNGGGGNGGGSSSISAPTGVSAEVSGSRVCVTWNSVSNASHYKVYRSSNSSGSFSVIASSTSNTYYYDASPNTNNYYKVTAVNSSGTESEKSDYAYCYYSSGGGGGGSAPSAPTGVLAEVSGSKIYVSWNSVSNANEYYIYWSNSSGSGYQQVGTTSNTYYYDNYPGEYNYYKIKAKNSYGESSYSSYAYCHYSSGGGGGGGGGSTNYAPCPPSVSASGTASSISVSWTKATGTGCGSPTSYKVYKRNPFTSSYELLTTTTSTSYRDYDVHPGINRYAVEAINNYGSDAGYGYSSSITLPKPTSFKAVKSGQDYIKFTWNKVNQATGYQIFQSSTASGTYYIFEQVEDVNTLTKYFPGVSGTTYYFKIKAIWDTGGYGGYETSDLSSWTSVTF